MSGEEEDEIKPDMTKLEKVNAIVSKAGLYWNGHYHLACVRLTFTLSNGCGVDAEFNPSHCNYRTLIDGVFGIDSEDGVYIDELNGKPCCCWLENRRLKYISNFMDDDKMIETVNSMRY